MNNLNNAINIYKEEKRREEEIEEGYNKRELKIEELKIEEIKGRIEEEEQNEVDRRIDLLREQQDIEEEQQWKEGHNENFIDKQRRIEEGKNNARNKGIDWKQGIVSIGRSTCQNKNKEDNKSF